jgi:hypothetical protein
MDEEVAFLDMRPPHWVANGLAYVVIATVVLALGTVILVQVPETVSGPFVLVPCSGMALSRQVEASAALIEEVDLPAELACAGEKLQAKLALPESQSAPVRPRQDVALLYDAFPSGRYGVRYGTVRWMSSIGVDSENGRSLQVFADLDDKMIVVDGKPRPLRAGMGGTAKIVLGKRSLIAHAFEPLRQLRENFASPPERPTKEKPS